MDTQNHKTDADAIVVGGGMSGLAAATYLARGGRSVKLYEKASETGGRAISQEHSGAVFNLGAHALYDKSPAIEVLRELGIKHTGGTPVGVRCISKGETYVAPQDPATLLRTALLSPAEKWEAARLLMKLPMSDPQSLAAVSVTEWLNREVKHPEVRRFLEASIRVTTYTNAPDRQSMGLATEQLQLVARGKVLYVDGGWQMLVNDLEQAALATGVQIATGAKVEAVEYTEGHVTGVRLADGTIHCADAVVVACGPQDLARLVEGSGANKAVQSWAQNAVPVKAACLDVALRRLPVPLNKVAISMDGPLFLTVQSEFSRVTKSGDVLLYALKYIDPEAPQSAEADKLELEAWLDLTQTGWKSEVIYSRYLPHLVVSNALVSAAGGGTANRPGPGVPDISGLYVAGDWVGPRGLLASASLWSARMAARAILASTSIMSRSKAA